MSSLFTKIISGKVPCHKILEDEKYFAFLDIRPIATGHTLVIPKTPVDYFFDLADPELGGILVFAKRVAAALRAAVPCQKVGVMVAGLEVPHAHIHLVPINHVRELSFANAKNVPDEELAGLAEKIRSHL